ncbi:MAG: V-type ATP synthase subunit D [Nitrospinae bacterium]|nr:V-type ATP synthase subunit D [Nitrospinota bacterium]
MNQTSPTRLNLLSLKTQHGLAKDGVRLLRSKRDALIMEFFTLMGDAAKFRDTLEKDTEDAFASLIMAKAFLGEDILTSAAYAHKRDINIDIEAKNIMGVIVPHIEDRNIKRAVDARGSSPVIESYRITEVAERFEDVLNDIVKVASKEIKLKRLGREIQTTTRRINVLEEILIPSLVNRIRRIERVLEEREREDIFRLKRFKRLTIIISSD